MGVPVITQVGTAAAGRAGKGLLTAMGLGDLVCSSPAEFIETAIMLAGDRQRRIALRTSLRQTIAQSPIMDARRFARKMESAFREMWARYCGKNA
jgi:predicted O-linked N-acetylglucosamine transferase (SPINDLY family)